MTVLNAQDIAITVDWLMPHFESGTDRSASLKLAFGIDGNGMKILQRINYSGAAYDFTVNLVSLLLKYGEFYPNTPALAVLLMTLKEQLGTDVQSLIKPIIDSLLTHPLEESIVIILNYHKNISQQRNIPFLTPAFLFALLTRKDLETGNPSYTFRVFNNFESGYATKMVKQLEYYLYTALPKHGVTYEDFAWNENDIVKSARKFAAKRQQLQITERALLEAILHSSGKTIQSLRDQIGNNRFKDLLRIVENMDETISDNATMTPGDIWGQS